MAQVNQPNVAPKETPLSLLMKGLDIASKVYGIKSDRAQLDEMQRRQDDADKLAQGVYNKNQQLTLGKEFDISQAKPQSGQFQEITDAATNSPLYVSLKKDNSPMFERIATVKNGQKGIGVVDQKALLRGSSPEEAMVGFYASAPEEKAPVKIETADADGNMIVRLVENKPGQVFSGAPKNPKLSKEQFDAALFGRRVETANQVLENLSTEGYDRTSSLEGAKAFLLPEAAQSPQLKQQKQAERNFLNAVLRRESGAAISAGEFESGEAQYFPRVGDTPEVLAQKAQNRQQALVGLQAAAGNAWEKVPAVALEAPKKAKSSEGQAFAAPAQQGPSPIDLLKIKAANGDKKAQEYLKSLGGQ